MLCAVHSVSLWHVTGWRLQYHSVMTDDQCGHNIRSAWGQNSHPIPLQHGCDSIHIQTTEKLLRGNRTLSLVFNKYSFVCNIWQHFLVLIILENTSTNKMSKKPIKFFCIYIINFSFFSNNYPSMSFWVPPPDENELYD